MDPKSPDDRPEAAAPQPLEWRFAQVFGERGAGEDVQEGKAAAAPVLLLLASRLARSTQFRSLVGGLTPPRLLKNAHFTQGMRVSPRFGRRRPLRIKGISCREASRDLGLKKRLVPGLHRVSRRSSIWFVAKCPTLYYGRTGA